MRALVVYDTAYGNTERIAKTVADAIEREVKLVRVAEANYSDLKDVDLLVVGSPTQGGKPTSAIQEFLRGMPAEALKETRVAAFDTRLSSTDQGIPLRLLMRLIGYASWRIASTLREKGGQLVVSPEGFIVDGKEGPLRDGEVGRAVAWSRELAT